MAGREGLLGHGQEAVKALVVEVGYVSDNPYPLQFPDGLPPEGGQAVVRHVSGTQLIFPVPGEGHHPHAILGQGLHPVQPARQGGAVLHREDGGGLAHGPGGFDVPGGAAGEGFFRQRLHLPAEIALVEVVVGHGLLLRQAVGDEDGAALAPADLLREGGQGEVPAGEVQGVGALYLLRQSSSGLSPPGGVVEGLHQRSGVGRQGGEGVAVQVNQGVGIHRRAPFKSGL